MTGAIRFFAGDCVGSSRQATGVIRLDLHLGGPSDLREAPIGELPGVGG